MEKFENKPIEYARYKQSHSDKIVFQDGKWQVLRTFHVRGYDSLMHKWSLPWKIGTKLLPLSEVGLSKSLNQTVYVRRTNVNPNTNQTIELWFKITRKVEVIDKENNIYLTESNNRIFQTDFTTTVAVPMNSVPQGLKITKLSEQPLTQQEFFKLQEDLNNPKIYIKPVCTEQTSTGELRLLT
ncbi:MAG: hypothetical protein ACE14S_06900 [Candidatus Bathyarchaeia archaeon]